MTKPARLILFVCSTLLFQAASAHGAEDLPRGDQSNLLRVGDLSGKEALVFEGNTTFSKEKILQGLMWRTEYHVAAHPAAPLAGYLAELERMLTAGYENAGFPEVTINAMADAKAQRVIIKIKEGPRYRCGEVLLSGVKRMTNEVVRKKIAETLAGVKRDTTLQTNLASAIWVRNDPAPFDNSSADRLQSMVGEALQSLNYYQPKVHVRIVPDPARGLADLRVEIADEGIRGTIQEIEVSGLRTNSRQQVLEFLQLKPGNAVSWRPHSVGVKPALAIGPILSTRGWS